MATVVTWRWASSKFVQYWDHFGLHYTESKFEMLFWAFPCFPVQFHEDIPADFQVIALGGSSWFDVFRWFEEVALLKAAKSDQNSATEKNKKYVYSSFMVKINFKFGSFGSFKICISQGQCMSKEFIKFTFLGFWWQKVLIFRVAKFWTLLHKVGDISESINIWWRKMDVGLVLFVFSFSKICIWFLGGPKFGYKFGILLGKCSICEDSCKIYVQFGDKVSMYR